VLAFTSLTAARRCSPSGQFWECPFDGSDLTPQAFERIFGPRAGELAQLLES
jgi:hypothetical protein